ncbi:MAG: hypothetical protein EOS46_04230 [Mesorhizobium sp.]|nr:MAG: hypothetical protein EOS46_04230 [Mesorhizobium sp.]
MSVADGCLDIGSNTVDRAIRPHTIKRKNAVFAGPDGGGRQGRRSPRSCRPPR